MSYSILIQVDTSSILPPGIVHIECVRGSYISKSAYFLVSNGKFFANDINKVSHTYHNKKLGHVLNDFVIDTYTFLKFIQKNLVKLKKVKDFLSKNKEAYKHGAEFSDGHMVMQRQAKKFFMESYNYLQRMSPMITRLVNTFCDW